MTSGFLIKRNGTAFSLPYKALHFVTVQFFIEAEKCRIDIQFSPPKTDSKNVFCNVKNSPSYCRASFAFMYFCEITLFCIFEGLWGTHTNERTHSWELKQSKAREKLHIPQKSETTSHSIEHRRLCICTRAWVALGENCRKIFILSNSDFSLSFRSA